MTDQGHTPDCPKFATHYPWQCDCRKVTAEQFAKAHRRLDPLVEKYMIEIATGMEMAQSVAIRASRHGKTMLQNKQRDDLLARGQTVVIVSAKPGGGIHACIVHPFRKRTR